MIDEPLNTVGSALIPPSIPMGAPAYSLPSASVASAKPVPLLSSIEGQQTVNTNANKLAKMETAYSGPSIVDYLGSVGQANDFGSRSKLAAEKGIQGYTGSAAQNTQLLQMLRNVTGSPAAQVMVDDLNKSVSQGGMTPQEMSGLKSLTTTQDGLLSAAAAARAALDSKDYSSMDFHVNRAEEQQKLWTDQLSEYFKSVAPLRQRQMDLLTPGSQEQQLSKQLNDIRTQAEQFKIQTEEDKFNEYQGQTLGFAGGRAAELDIRGNFKLERMAAEEKNLLLSLGLEKEARTMESSAVDKQIGYLADDFELQSKVQEKITAMEDTLFERADTLRGEAKDTLATILESLAGVDPATMPPETVTQLQQLAARANLPYDIVEQALKVQHAQQAFDNAIKTTTANRQTSEGLPAKVKSGGLVTDESEIATVQASMTKGTDGYTDPYVYRKAYDAWIANQGLTQDFIKFFPPKLYINPNFTNPEGQEVLPSYLLNEDEYGTL